MSEAEIKKMEEMINEICDFELLTGGEGENSLIEGMFSEASLNEMFNFK